MEKREKKMAAIGTSYANVEAGGGSAGGGGGPVHRQRRRHRRVRRHSVACSSEATTTDGSLCFSDSDDQSRVNSTAGASYDECGSSGIEGSSDCGSEEEVDLESGELEMKVHLGKEERDCRICHLNINSVGIGNGTGTVTGGRVGGDQEEERGISIELGCDCKGDLGAAHKQCAETWFKIKGNTTCEICGATALNVGGEQTNEASNAPETTAAGAAAIVPYEPRSFWQGRRIMNFLLGCMVLAFIISWLFHFNVLP